MGSGRPARSLTQFPEGEGPIPRAYKPIVSLDASDLKGISQNTEKWLDGDLEDLTRYTRSKVLAIYQALGTIALKDVGGRNGLNARIQAAKGFFEMAPKVLAIVKDVRREAGFDREEVKPKKKSR